VNLRIKGAKPTQGLWVTYGKHPMEQHWVNEVGDPVVRDVYRTLPTHLTSAFLTASKTEPGVYSTNVNPARISNLRVTVANFHRFTFKDVPMEPRGG
jgi:hypothetical protein